VKHAWIEAHQRSYPIAIACEVLGVSTSGYHDHRQRRQQLTGAPPTSTPPRLSNERIVTHIRIIHAEVKHEYGWPRMWRELKARGFRVGKERVQKLMREHGIRAKAKRRFKLTTDSNHRYPVAANLVARHFSPAAPNQIWTSDITYIDTGEGWLYLAVMIDLFSRQVVGFAMAPHMRSELVVSALRMGWFRRHPAKGLIVHTDRGSQYCGEAFQDTLRAYGMVSSMSRRGDCWDNAPTESLWSRLKAARVHGVKFATHQQAINEVMDWLHFYNQKRLHSTLNYVSPMQFEAAWHAVQEKRAA
jgi:putative transposase